MYKLFKWKLRADTYPYLTLDNNIKSYVCGVFFSKYSKRRGHISRQNCPLNILLFTQDRDGFLKHVPNVIT